MKHKEKIRGLLGALLMLALILPACQTYQVGAALEPRPHANAQGVFFGGDWIDENWDVTLAYYPNAHPWEDGGSQFDGESGNIGVGFSQLYKYPINFLGNHLSIFPMLGYDFNYFQLPADSDDYYDDILDTFGFGVKFGGGFDISFTKQFFLRGKVLYSPEFLSFMQNEPGLRYGLSIGYRTEGDTIRRGFKTFSELSRETALKNAKEQFEKHNYDSAIAYYRQAIGLKASLGTTGVSNLAASYYERAKQNQGKGDYRQAVADMNESLRHQNMMSLQRYAEWKELLAQYETNYGSQAPQGNFGKLIFPRNDNLTISYDRAANGQTDPNEINGTGWNRNIPAGSRTFSLAYDEGSYNKGFLKSDTVRINLEVEAGHIYEAEGTVAENQVTITVTDVTERELRQDFSESTRPIFSRTLPLREERPREERASINIVNNTGYTVYYMYVSPADSDTWGSDVLDSSEVLRNRSSRRVSLPPLNTARRYDIKLEDKDGDTYTKWGVTITNNMTITFTISDLD